MYTTTKIKIEPSVEFKSEKCENFDDQTSMMADIKIKPGHEIKVEKIAEMNLSIN